jgi:hypothetical protein
MAAAGHPYSTDRIWELSCWLIVFSRAISPLSSRCGSRPVIRDSLFRRGEPCNVADLAVQNRCAPFSNPLDGSEKAWSTPVSNPIPEPLLEPIDPLFEAKKIFGCER